MPNFITDGFDPGDDEAVIAILKKWKGGVLSDRLFTELAGIIPQPISELVILRGVDGQIETLTIPRPEGDLVWPGMYHTPGQAFRRSDFLLEDPLQGPFFRVRTRELAGADWVIGPKACGVINRNTARGPEIVQIFWATIPEDFEVPKAKWQNILQLKEDSNFIQHQVEHIFLAAGNFSAYKFVEKRAKQP